MSVFFRFFICVNFTVHVRTYFVLCSCCGSHVVVCLVSEAKGKGGEREGRGGWGGGSRFLTRGRDFPTRTCVQYYSRADFFPAPVTITPHHNSTERWPSITLYRDDNLTRNIHEKKRTQHAHKCVCKNTHFSFRQIYSIRYMQVKFLLYIVNASTHWCANRQPWHTQRLDKIAHKKHSHMCGNDLTPSYISSHTHTQTHTQSLSRADDHFQPWAEDRGPSMLNNWVRNDSIRSNIKDLFRRSREGHSTLN